MSAPSCPRCLGSIPNNLTPGAYGGATSRTDDETEICSACGSLEAYEQAVLGGVTPQERWLPNLEAWIKAQKAPAGA